MNLKRTKVAHTPPDRAQSPWKSVVLWWVLAGLIAATPFALYGLGVHQPAPPPAPASAPVPPAAATPDSLPAAQHSDDAPLAQDATQGGKAGGTQRRGQDL